MQLLGRVVVLFVVVGLGDIFVCYKSSGFWCFFFDFVFSLEFGVCFGGLLVFIMEQLSLVNICFVLDLFLVLSENNLVGNIFIFFFSILFVMVMVFLGIRGNMVVQLFKIFYFNMVEEVYLRFQSLNVDINKCGVFYILKFVNRLYGEKIYNFFFEFLVLIQKIYGVDLVSVDFQYVFEDVRKIINQWVKGQIEGKILELLVLGMVDNMIKFVLVNVIYFKGNWKDKFMKEVMMNVLFRLNKKDRKIVKMMYQKKKFVYGYIEDFKCCVLELFY